MNLRDMQLQYEEDSDAQAAAERYEYLKNSADAGDINMPRAQRFIARAYSKVKEELEAVAAVQTRGVGGKFKSWLRKVPLDVAAVIALRECIARCSSNRRDAEAKPTMQLLASNIGSMYELEVKVREAEKVNPLYMKKVYEQVKESGTTSTSHLRKLYNTAYKHIMDGEVDSSLTAVERLQLGKFGVQAVADVGIIQVKHGVSLRLGKEVYFELSPEVAEFLKDYTQGDVEHVLSTSTGGMLCEPDPWTNTMDGGYLSPRRKFGTPLLPMQAVRRSERKRLRTEVFTAEKMPKVFQAANYIQGTAFQIHAPTLQAIQEVCKTGGGVMGVPTARPPTRPDFPFPDTWVASEASEVEVETFRSWKRQCVQYYADLRTWRGRAREVAGFVKFSTMSAGLLWFPVFVDKRGRWYYRGSPNPQGSDLAKAVLHFGEKRPLGKRGVFWLKVHIANCFGFDKPRFAKRAAWTEENWEAISRALSCPQDYPDVWGDAPWCMYSAAYELQQAYASGDPESYCTGIPVHMDATCSGLQHFAAMLRDPVGGAYVNLVDAGAEQTHKQDIYARVAENAMASIGQDALDSRSDKAALARWWGKRGISRALAKKPVMTYVYGATLRGTSEFVLDHLMNEGLKDWPNEYRKYDVAAYAARKLFDGIAATVPAAEAGMRWLRSIAKGMPNGQRMEWTTPTGFKVQHDYQDYDEVRVWIRSCGVSTALVREYNEDTRPLAMQNAIAPNFVHALDASHLTLTALRMQEMGLQMVGIHDSFGTHPSEVDVMHQCIREAFVNLYTQNNVLADFLWEVGGIGEVPMRGTLQLSEVLKSEFFFC